MELKAKIQAVIAGAKEQSKAEADSVEGGGPMVTEADIANIVAQWTGIPIEKVCAPTLFLLLVVAFCFYMNSLFDWLPTETCARVLYMMYNRSRPTRPSD